MTDMESRWGPGGGKGQTLVGDSRTRHEGAGRRIATDHGCPCSRPFQVLWASVPGLEEMMILHCLGCTQCRRTGAHPSWLFLPRATPKGSCEAPKFSRPGSCLPTSWQRLQPGGRAARASCSRAGSLEPGAGSFPRPCSPCRPVWKHWLFTPPRSSSRPASSACSTHTNWSLSLRRSLLSDRFFKNRHRF